MKFPFQCNSPDCRALNPLEYSEEDLYRYRCAACETKNAHALRQEKFEVLLDFGSMAFLDGYHREAVADFATALERFFEFFTKAVFRERGLGPEAVGETWKVMSRQTERQLGAFATAYLQATGRAPSFLDPNRLRVGFRNDVVHKGLMPSREQALAYAETVHGLIQRLLGELWRVAPNSVGRMREDVLRELGEKAKAEGRLYSVYAYDGMFGVLRFHPPVAEIDAESYRSYEESGGPGLVEAGWEYLRTDLGFEETLRARRAFLEASFYDEGRHGSEGTVPGPASG